LTLLYLAVQNDDSLKNVHRLLLLLHNADVQLVVILIGLLGSLQNYRLTDASISTNHLVIIIIIISIFVKHHKVVTTTTTAPSMGSAMLKCRLVSMESHIQIQVWSRRLFQIRFQYWCANMQMPLRLKYQTGKKVKV